VTRRVERLCASVACCAAAAALSACGGSSEPQPKRPTSAANQAKASVTESTPNKELDPEPVDRDVSELTGFVSPTANVSCMIDADWARYDIIDRDWAPPPRPADCEFDYGQGISLAPGGPAEFACAGDTALGADEALPYGESITSGPLRCDSAESGITCRDAQSGHGFSISRQAYRLF